MQSAGSFINADLQRFLDVSVGQELNLNSSNSCLMLFGSKLRRQELKGKLKLKVEGADIQFIETCKGLGYLTLSTRHDLSL